MISIQQMMSYQKNGCFQPPPPGPLRKPEHLSPDVARLMQLEEGIRPPDKKRSPHLSPHHYKRDHKDKDHCTIDMNGLETNV